MTTTSTDCPLCAELGGTLIWQDGLLRVVLVDEPQYPGFVRVIWQTHVTEMTDLPPLHRQHMMRTVMVVEQAQRDVFKPHKINLASLGNMVPHVHWHVIPRFVDDLHYPNAIWAQAGRDADAALQRALPRQDLVAHLSAQIVQKLDQIALQP